MTTLFDLPFEEPAPEPPTDPASPAESGAARAAPPARRVYTVAELTAEIRTLLEERFFEVWVEGEISNCRCWNSGHWYFTLKDGDAQIKAVMFRTAARRLKFTLQDGQHVLARARVSIYDAKGEYQLVCEHVEPRGAGALQLAFEQLKKRLAAEGLFDDARKRPLPALPRKIGIVTSLDGAALRDIIKVLRHRYANAHLIVRPARVQGEGAAQDIARGIAALSTLPGVDVMIVGRGGGSIEDLWAFNEEVVARAIAACPVPVISGVGHQVDFTIADFVADRRAATPSNAAEIVVAAKEGFCARIERLSEWAASAARAAVVRRRTAVHRLTVRPGLAGFPARVAMRGRRIAELAHDLRRVVQEATTRRERRWTLLRFRLEACDQRRRLTTLRARVAAGAGRIHAAVSRRTQRADGRFRQLAGRLEALSPLAVLGRGYAICWDQTRTRAIRSASPELVGRRVHVTLADGDLRCTVDAAAAKGRTRDAGPEP
jgi:exodeoxyribonuclease VII large subunit